MTDTLMRFDTEAAAKADPTVGVYCIEDSWRGDVCIPNVTVSNDAGDVIDGWFIRIAENAALASMAYAVPDGYSAQPVFAA